MANSAYYGSMLAAGMLLTGTLNTLLTKLQDKQCVGNCTDPDASKREYFEQPVWQTLNMFYGEMLCLACFYLFSMLRCRCNDSHGPDNRDGYMPISEPSDEDESPNARIAEDVPTTDALSVTASADAENAPADALVQLKPISGWATLWMWVPAVCDLLGTTLMNVGLFFTTASVYQMLRGAVVIFSGLFSVLFLGHRLEFFQVVSLVLVVLGVTIVGLSNVISPPVQVYSHAGPGDDPQSIDTEVWKAVLGVSLVLGAQIFTATQFVVEEKIIRRYHLTPLRAVGLEGSFGAITVMAAIPVLHLAIGRYNPGGYFDAPSGFRQIVDNPSVWQTSIYIMLSIALFNFFGLSVTRYLSATSRATIDTCRTLFIWMSSLALGWETFSWIQVIGFAVLVYAKWNSSVQEFSSKLKTLKADLVSNSHRSNALASKGKRLSIKGLEISGMVDLANASNDTDLMLELAAGDISDFCTNVNNFMLERRLRCEEDSSAIVVITAGAGGNDSCEWTEMLANMYRGWSMYNNFKISYISETHGEAIGFRSVTFKISGSYVYSWLKGESGVQRLVRISPFDAKGKRHTSFASVLVYPVTNTRVSEACNSYNTRIATKDIQIDTFKSSGPGGQSVNKTESAVRITHIPTGIAAECQCGRSQVQNRKLGLELLQAKLERLEKNKEKQRRAEERNRLPGNEWGSQVRSYIMHPYQLVKDSRSGYTSNQITSILKGQINDLLKAQLIETAGSIHN
ncbi:hypothetical protein EV179_003095 [Coemansia sp. RSA 487]|nr:hypothetical protein EV179_003095 [Coemansia sp. RSA 487]